MQAGATFLMTIAMGWSVAAGAVDTAASSIPLGAFLEDRGGNDVIDIPAGTLYYDKSTGRGMIAGVNADGDPSFRIDYDFGAGWEKIVCLGSSLFFYAADGRAALGHIDSKDRFVRTRVYAAGTFRSFNKALASPEVQQKLR